MTCCQMSCRCQPQGHDVVQYLMHRSSLAETVGEQHLAAAWRSQNWRASLQQPVAQGRSGRGWAPCPAQWSHGSWPSSRGAGSRVTGRAGPRWAGRHAAASRPSAHCTCACAGGSGTPCTCTPRTACTETPPHQSACSCSRDPCHALKSHLNAIATGCHLMSCRAGQELQVSCTYSTWKRACIMTHSQQRRLHSRVHVSQAGCSQHP